MKTSEPSAPDAASTAANRALLAASTLALGRQIDLWSLWLAAVALIVLFGPAQPNGAHVALLISLLAAGIQKSFALRTALDAGIFGFWAKQWCRNAQGEDGGKTVYRDLVAFDQALREQFPGASHGTATETRALEPRIAGAKRLLRRQALAFACQFACLLLALVFHCTTTPAVI